MIQVSGPTWASGSCMPGCTESLVTPTILGGLHGIRTVRTASFEVLVSPPLPSSTGRAIGLYSWISQTPSGTRAQVEAFVDRSSAIALSVRGMWCRSRTSKSFFYLLGMEQVCGQLGFIPAVFAFHLHDDQLDIALHKCWHFLSSSASTRNCQCSTSPEVFSRYHIYIFPREEGSLSYLRLTQRITPMSTTSLYRGYVN
jgi:hypothetical protein